MYAHVCTRDVAYGRLRTLRKSRRVACVRTGVSSQLGSARGPGPTHSFSDLPQIVVTNVPGSVYFGTLTGPHHQVSGFPQQSSTLKWPDVSPAPTTVLR